MGKDGEKAEQSPLKLLELGQAVSMQPDKSLSSESKDLAPLIGSWNRKTGETLAN